MGDFASSFGMGFEIGSIIKEKRKAKKILEQVQNTLQEWKLSGEEPSYVDKILMSVLLNQAGTSYASSFANIENDKNAMDREKLSQDGLNLRTLNDNGVALLKMIETSAKEGTLGLIDWFQVPKEMFPPNFDLNKFLSKDTISKLQDENTRQEALDEIMGVTKALPEEYRKGYMEQQGVIEPGLQPTTTPKAPGISDYKGAVDYLKNFSKITTPPDTFNKVKAGLQNKFPDIDLSDITQESLREPEKAVGAEKPRVTSLPQLEEYRDKALKADSWEDAQNIINDYTEAGYDTSQLKINKEVWINHKKEYLNNILNLIKSTINEKGWLKSGEITPQEVGGIIDKNKPAPEAYEEFRKEYMKYRDILEKAGVDVSQFPKLKPLSEIEKVGFIEGIKTFGGVGKGQYKSIYY